MKDIIASPSAESTWLDVLEQEAQRDLVFIWHIVVGAFGGPRASADTAAPQIRRVVEALLDRGCMIGFGDPDQSSWRVPPELLQDKSSERGATVAALWSADPQAWEFLVLARRPRVAQLLARGASKNL